MSPDSTRTPTGTLQWPLPVAGTITSQFGHRVDPITGEVSSHTGTDIACAEGTPILEMCIRDSLEPVPYSAFSFGKYLIGLLVLGNQALGDFENVLVFSLLLVLDLAELH